MPRGYPNKPVKRKYTKRIGQGTGRLQAEKALIVYTKNLEHQLKAARKLLVIMHRTSNS